MTRRPTPWGDTGARHATCSSPTGKSITATTFVNGDGMNWYNENDPYCAQWLRNLVSAGHIPPGDVNERDIRDVTPAELAGYVQCHFFVGIGGWPRALALAGIGADRPLWTGSCPCQPFSAAGKRVGFSDERHLWPSWFWLISQCRPAVVLGEQTARSADWQRLVHGDLEALGYAVGAIPVEAASVGAPHRRDRFWFVGVSNGDGRPTAADGGTPAADADRTSRRSATGNADTGAGSEALRAGETEPGRRSAPVAEHCERGSCCFNPDECDANDCWLLKHPEHTPPPAQWKIDDAVADADGPRLAKWIGQRSDTRSQQPAAERSSHAADTDEQSLGRVAIARGECDWWLVESDVGRVAHGVPARVGKLRALGNAIVPQCAAAFIATLEGEL